MEKDGSKGQRVTGAAGADVGSEAASGAPRLKSGPQASVGLPFTRRGSLADQSSMFHEQCCRVAEEEEGSGTEGVRGNLG